MARRYKIKKINEKTFYCYSALGIKSLVNDFVLCLEKSECCNELTLCNADLIDSLMKALFWNRCKLESVRKVEMYGTCYYNYYCCYKNNLLNTHMYILDYLYQNNYESGKYVFDIYLSQRIDKLAHQNDDELFSIGIELSANQSIRNFDFENIFNQFEIMYVPDENKYGIFLFTAHVKL